MHMAFFCVGEMKDFYAHSKDGEPVENWQPLADHLNQVAQLAAQFAQPFGAEAWASICGVHHD